MKKILFILFFLITLASAAQDKGIIQGIVLDSAVNNEPLAFASVTVKGTAINATTDLDGVHRLRLNPGSYTLVFNFPGYQKIELPNVIVKKDQVTQVKNISLMAMTLTFSEDVGEKEETSRIKR